MTKNKQLQQQDITTQCVTGTAAKSVIKSANYLFKPNDPRF